jgi:hypothetical protein
MISLVLGELIVGALSGRSTTKFAPDDQLG